MRVAGNLWTPVPPVGWKISLESSVNSSDNSIHLVILVDGAGRFCALYLKTSSWCPFGVRCFLSCSVDVVRWNYVCSVHRGPFVLQPKYSGENDWSKLYNINPQILIKYPLNIVDIDHAGKFSRERLILCTNVYVVGAPLPLLLDKGCGGLLSSDGDRLFRKDQRMKAQKRGPSLHTNALSTFHQVSW